MEDNLPTTTSLHDNIAVVRDKEKTVAIRFPQSSPWTIWLPGTSFSCPVLRAVDLARMTREEILEYFKEAPPVEYLGRVPLSAHSDINPRDAFSTFVSTVERLTKDFETIISFGGKRK